MDTIDSLTDFLGNTTESSEVDNTPNVLPANSHYVAIGTTSDLNNLCNLISNGGITVRIESLESEAFKVYANDYTFYVNRYWKDKITSLLVLEPTIPVNPGSLSVDETTSRFSSAIWYNKIKSKVIVLAGIGGIGSYIAFLLARMKPEFIYMYDPDYVETVNMSGQLYGLSDIGNTKVESISKMIKNYADYNRIVAFDSMFTLDSEAYDIMICGFDNMVARKIFFTKWLNHVMDKAPEDRANCILIDGRLAAEEFQVFAIQGNDDRAIEEYQNKWLFMDSQAEETICSYKQTTFMANMIASVIINIFVNFVANECGPIVPRDVPFLTQYSADTMFFKVEI